MRTLNHSGNYVVRSGDTLSQIAEEFKSTLEELLAFNPTISNTNLIFPGQQIKLPIHCIELYVERLAADGNGYANEGRRLYQLCQQYGAKPGSTKTWLEQVLACLDRPLPIPDGYQLVPNKMNRAMLDAADAYHESPAYQNDVRPDEYTNAECYEAVLAAAPVPVLPLREAIRLNIERAQKAAGRLSDKAIENALDNPLTRDQVADALADVPPSIGVRNFPCLRQRLVGELNKSLDKAGKYLPTAEEVGEMLFDHGKMQKFFDEGLPFRPQVEYGILNDPKVGAIPTTSLFDVDVLSDILYEAGWRSHADAQHEGLRKAIPNIAKALIEKGAVLLETAATQRLQKLLDEAQECIDHQRKTLIKQAKNVDEAQAKSEYWKGIADRLNAGQAIHSIACRQFPAGAEGVPACRSDCECKPSAPTAPEVPPRAPTSDDCQGIINLEHRWVDSAGGHGRQFCHKCGMIRGPQLSSADKVDWALNFLSKFEAQQPEEF